MEDYIIEEIPEEVVKRYGIGQSYTIESGHISIVLPPVMKSPFSGFAISKTEDRFYIHVRREKPVEELHHDVRT
jgi:hypothetical protein